MQYEVFLQLHSVLLFLLHCRHLQLLQGSKSPPVGQNKHFSPGISLPNSCMPHLNNSSHNIHVTSKKMLSFQAVSFSKQQQINGFSSGLLSCYKLTPVKCFPLGSNLPYRPPDTVWMWLSQGKCDSPLWIPKSLCCSRSTNMPGSHFTLYFLALVL